MAVSINLLTVFSGPRYIRKFHGSSNARRKNTVERNDGTGYYRIGKFSNGNRTAYRNANARKHDPFILTQISCACFRRIYRRNLDKEPFRPETRSELEYHELQAYHITSMHRELIPQTRYSISRFIIQGKFLSGIHRAARIWLLVQNGMRLQRC